MENVEKYGLFKYAMHSVFDERIHFSTFDLALMDSVCVDMLEANFVCYYVILMQKPSEEGDTVLFENLLLSFSQKFPRLYVLVCAFG